MKRYVLLSMEDDDARSLIEDMKLHPDYPLLSPVHESSIPARLVSSWPALDVSPALDAIALDWAAVSAARATANRQDPYGLVPAPVRNAFDRFYWLAIAREVLRAYTEARAGAVGQ
jgi:hypothetical protein